ncbi:glycosyltransferase family 2 protein [Corynebacterium cystitidis]|uniref:Glycosyltransferase, catalytic subunit of cellulose synthase and poly-beta-1,6-N-acetylglucosamine synthase n=1 Tax=Corynebacterium cystitidis DSM 20524 TaxID=1121357 RepID=A0A1H9TRD1_9CORY|nr:glycosyltransferase [Corynebacterium cystitidis]WJY81983.1 Poly-beta-1,6-N-acetyl-D-glucosamine synthase [Corynebacterium cystitidis DSM 20524]SER99745.1 Glycosyltransferase, catalytic subunit of cellulose synthase and poly-beta-1,6-N-acetylglucosamine synthase [Corynebacterium cystitidis DSM 20524]SNV81244.1 putative glycosyltransferase [Corynebacterium cystitidis]
MGRVFLAAYLLLVVLFYFAMMVVALFKTNRNRRFERSLDLVSNSDFYNLGVSILVPAYNEETGIIHNVSSLLNLDYHNFEILVVNDGSTDSTSSLLIEHFDMELVPTPHPAAHLHTQNVRDVYVSKIFRNLKLINKHNGGKADALNCGINFSAMDYVCTVDGDSVLEKDSLKKVMRPFILDGQQVAAAGGSVELINENQVEYGVPDKQVEFSSNPLVAIQSIEYYRSFLIGRVALSQQNWMLICSGAFTVFDKDLIVRYGGLATDVIGEDMEIVVRLQKQMVNDNVGKRIVHVPDAICYTEAPESLRVLRRQRRRWHQGLLESLWRHKEVTLNPRYGSLGLVAFPYFILAEALIPLVELFGFAYLVAGFFAGQVFLEFSLTLLVFSLLYSGLMSMIAVMLNAWQQGKYPDLSEITYVLGLSFTEFFWYKPLMLFWRLEGFYRFFTNRSDWGAMERMGFTEAKQEIAS